MMLTTREAGWQQSMAAAKQAAQAARPTFFLPDPGWKGYLTYPKSRPAAGRGRGCRASWAGQRALAGARSASASGAARSEAAHRVHGACAGCPPTPQQCGAAQPRTVGPALGVAGVDDEAGQVQVPLLLR